METLQKSYEVFAKLLEAHGITPYRIYKATGVPQSSMSEWKRGNSMPKIDKLQKIAEYFGVTVDYLLGKEEKPAPKDELNIGTPYTPTHRIPILGRVPAGIVGAVYGLFKWSSNKTKGTTKKKVNAPPDNQIDLLISPSVIADMNAVSEGIEINKAKKAKSDSEITAPKAPKIKVKIKKRGN